MKEKRRDLRQILAGMNNVLVAYSGGVDSTLLVKIAHDLLGDRAAAAMIISPTLPELELDAARKVAQELGIRLIEFESREMDLPEFRANTEQRCYVCKDYRYQLLQDYASANGWSQLVDGSNYDDLDDFRPGRLAAQERNVRSPLQEVGLTKKEIRIWARELNLENWDKPSSACLASRIPYGTEITPALLAQVEEAEAYLGGLGFRDLRVRHHGDIARIEVLPEDFNKLLQKRSEVINRFRRLGFIFITLDMLGFRSGSLNQGINSHG